MDPCRPPASEFRSVVVLLFRSPQRPSFRNSHLHAHRHGTAHLPHWYCSPRRRRAMVGKSGVKAGAADDVGVGLDEYPRVGVLDLHEGV